MTDEIPAFDADTQTTETPTPTAKADERYAVSPMERRFLFVDIAAQRAKQLRKGALNRIVLAANAGDPTLTGREGGIKPERVAMEEVRRGFIQYQLPDGPPVAPKPEA